MQLGLGSWSPEQDQTLTIMKLVVLKLIFYMTYKIVLVRGSGCVLE